MSALPIKSCRSWRLSSVLGALLLTSTLAQANDGRLHEVRLHFNTAPVSPVPLRLDIDPSRQDLGRRLFFDPRLSADGETHCGSCHQLPPIAEDVSVEFSKELMGEYKRSVPLLYNVGDFFWLNWDGRFSSLEQLVDDAITDPNKLNTSWDAVMKRLQPVYGADVAELTHEPMTKQDVVAALTLFLRSLSTPNARFDRYLRGDMAALTEQEQQGYRLFLQVGCVSCHNGRSLGANFFEEFYIYRHDGGEEGEPRLKDKGRFYVTGESQDANLFRVPTLRNVAQTAPYFHDGSADNLYHAIEEMAEHQLGVELSRTEIEHLEAFLKTLTGNHPGVLP